MTAPPGPRPGFPRGAGRQLGVGVVTTAIVFGFAIAAFVPGVLVLADSVQAEIKRVGLTQLSQRSSVVDAAGNVLGQLGSQDREEVTLDQVPKVLQDAV